MRGIDTNVLVRYLTGDDVRQAKRVERFVNRCARDGEEIYLAQVVLCEAVWVLTTCYHRTRQEIAEVLEMLLETEQMQVAGRDQVRRALADYWQGPGDFADYLIGTGNQEAGCNTTVTFDRKLKGHPAFALLK